MPGRRCSPCQPTTHQGKPPGERITTIWSLASAWSSGSGASIGLALRTQGFGEFRESGHVDDMQVEVRARLRTTLLHP